MSFFIKNMKYLTNMPIVKENNLKKMKSIFLMTYFFSH